MKHAWNLFANEDTPKRRSPTGSSYSVNPTRPRYTRGNERTTVTAVYSRIAVDSASIKMRHIRLDSEGRYVDNMDTLLNNCLTVESNIDQTSRAFMQDIVASLLDEGCIAVVPIVTSKDPDITNAFDIETMRTARITQWYPEHVNVLLYDDRTGMKREVTVPKSQVAIIENPLYAVMNEPNSTMQRLIAKLNMLDNVDEATSSGNLDLLVQLPYPVKTEAKKNLAEERRKAIEEQLNDAKYGVAYIDGTEKVTQLNRPIENNLMKQIEYLTNLLFSQLGITQGVLDGTADDKTMNNYYNRTIEPILGAIVDEFNRKFLTKTARTQLQAIQYFRDPFKLISVSDLPDVVDKFTRNEVLTSNEVRQIIGLKPSKDPAADELRNKNISQAKDHNAAQPTQPVNEEDENNEEV